jgi:hypothetical protein
MTLMRRPDDRRPWGLIIALSVAITAGVVSIPLQVLTFQQVETASRADVARNGKLTEQVQSLQRDSQTDQGQHRSRNEAAHQDLCDRLRSLQRALNVVDPPPCPEPPPDMPLHND